MKLFSLIPLLITRALLASSYLDVQFSADPYDLRGQSHFDFTAPHFFLYNGGSVVLTPEVSIYTNSNIELGLAVAKKFQFGEHILGSHVFYDRSHISGSAFHQAGVGAVYSTDNFEITSNYYHPLTSASGTAWTSVSPCKWIDSEFLLKTSYFSVGTGPVYNIDYKHMALHSRLLIPTSHCIFSVGGLIGEGGFTQGFLSISFNLMKNGEITALSTPISRTKKCSVAFYSSQENKAANLQKYAGQVEREMVLPKNVSAEKSSSAAPVEEAQQSE